MLEAFQGIPFADAGKAEHILEEIIGPDQPKLAARLALALRETAQPDGVLVRLARYLEASPSRTTDLELMASTPHHARLLVTLLGQSHYLTDIVCRNPEYMAWLWSETDLGHAATREELLTELRQQVTAFDTFDGRCQSLRRFKRRQTLRIASRELFAHASVRSVTEDLSNLADACLEVALESAEEELQRPFGVPHKAGDIAARATFCVLAMGKLGGRELNFSSDIDLVFLYSDDGETSGGSKGSVGNEAYFQRLSELLIKALSESTEEGYAFRVDMRLRPYGGSGPLSISLESAMAYYESLGQAWERQALIKARAAAGDLDLGQQFLERIGSFVFPRYFDDETLEEIRQVKQQMETEVARQGRLDREVKLGRGGIRDIEFTVQTLQILNGGRISELRVASTLDAIDALQHHALLRPFEADTLASNYNFLRKVEHRLQIKGGHQVHTLPRAPAELDEFAQRLGYASGESFMADYRERTEGTRAVLERFLAIEAAGTRWIYDVLHPQQDGQMGFTGLAKLGFASPERARDELIRLYAGPEERPHTLRVRQQFTAIAPVLLKTIVSYGDPDAILMRLGRLLSSVGSAGPLYNILRDNPHFCQYLVGLVANSEYLTTILFQDPGLFDTFQRPELLDRPAAREELEEDLAQLSEARNPEAAIYRFHAGQTLRIGLRDLFRDVNIYEIGQELTLLAEVCINYALSEAHARTAERYGPPPGPFAILGLGKLGGMELGYGSDLDLVFTYETNGQISSATAPAEYFAAVASHTLNGLKEHTRYGMLYDVDARLRPHGKKGVLAVSTTGLEDYYLHEAQAWERLALTKVRAVAGNPEFCRRLDASARQLAYARAFTRADIKQIADMRDKLADTATPLDLKKDVGGLIEIEFAVRLLQMRHAQRAAELRCGHVATAIPRLAAVQALSEEQAATLLEAYTFFRQVENRIRMAKGTSGSSLPEDPAWQADLAKRLGIHGDLAQRAAQTKRCVRSIYEAVVGRLLATC